MPAYLDFPCPGEMGYTLGGHMGSYRIAESEDPEIFTFLSDTESNEKITPVRVIEKYQYYQQTAKNR